MSLVEITTDNKRVVTCRCRDNHRQQEGGYVSLVEITTDNKRVVTWSL